MKLSVIIPTYNGLLQLQTIDPLLRLLKEEYQKEVEIIIVDNGSTDNTKDFLEKQEFIKTIYLQENGGFTKGVNEGAKIANGEYLLILNNDCMFEVSAIKELISFLNTHLEYVATQPIIMKPDKSIEQIGYLVDLTVSRAQVIKDQNFDFQQYQVQKDMFQRGKMYGLSGTCLLIRENEFKNIGMLDTTFHSYLEDVDFCIRLALKGYSYGPCLQAKVTHEHMATSSKMGTYKEWHDFVNWIKIILKNYPKIFVISHFISLSIERLRNLNGYLKKKMR